MAISTLGFKGKVIYLQLSTNGSAWKTAAALDKKSFKLDNEEIDVTNDTTPGNLKELAPGVQTPSLDWEGFAYKATAPSGYVSFKEILGYASAQTIVYARLVDDTTTPADLNISGTGFIKSVEEQYETNKYTNYKGSFSFQTLVIA